MSKTQKITSVVVLLVAAIILLQTLFQIYRSRGKYLHFFYYRYVALGPYRLRNIELLAATLLIVPRTIWLGAILSLDVMGGAIFFHLTKLGLVVQDDGGLLFALAIITAVSSALATFLHRNQVPFNI